jgi:hypothetical protein
MIAQPIAIQQSHIRIQHLSAHGNICPLSGGLLHGMAQYCRLACEGRHKKPSNNNEKKKKIKDSTKKLKTLSDLSPNFVQFCTTTSTFSQIQNGATGLFKYKLIRGYSCLRKRRGGGGQPCGSPPLIQNGSEIWELPGHPGIFRNNPTASKVTYMH